MMMTTLAKRIVNSAFARMGPALREHTALLVERNYEGISYGRLARWGYRPATIIDVGAFRGDWALTARRAFGPVPTLMIEAQAGLLAHLHEIAAKEHGLSVAHAILGARDGQAVEFFEMGTGSSIFPEASDAPRTASRQVTQTLDRVVSERLGSLSDAFYSACYGNADRMNSILEGIGYKKIEVRTFYRHFYYEKIPLLSSIHRRFSSLAARHNWTFLGSYAYITAYK